MQRLKRSKLLLFHGLQLISRITALFKVSINVIFIILYGIIGLGATFNSSLANFKDEFQKKIKGM